jgi:hypothetical protein
MLKADRTESARIAIAVAMGAIQPRLLAKS